MRALPRSKKECAAAVGLLLLLAPLLAAGTKHLKPGANPPGYEAFSRPLTQAQRFQHALDRLTFGPRPGDLQTVRQQGLDQWIKNQLHPEKLPENPILAERLQPYDSLRMSIHEAYVHYPPPQLIRAYARGTGRLPDDPELRAVVVHLAYKYLQKRESNGPALQNVADNAEDADLEPKIKLADLLTPAQMDTLHNGTPEQKKQLLLSIPPDKRMDFAWALRQRERQQLMNLAPVDFRRQLMLSANPQNVVASDLSEGKLLRAVYSTHQLQELLVDFWFNHFNVFLNKGADRYLIPSYERDAIRPHVFGKFYDLLLTTAKSPAMLFYLDNWQSVGPEAPGAKGKKRGLNENYGRELLELHTLGVDGGYTQKDVIEVARCFTGWTIQAPRKGGEFEYNDKVHDKGQKIVLGHVIPAGGGMDDGLKVLDILVHHPATAHHISFELAQAFVADNPPPSLVNRMAATFTKTNGDLRQVMQTMLKAPEFWSQGAYQAKIKTPFQMIVSAVRATNANVEAAYALDNQLQRLGEPLYRKIEPTGYSNLNTEWVSSAGLLDRMNFALALAHNRLPGVAIDSAYWQAQTQNNPDALAATLLQRQPSTETLDAIHKMLASPDLQRQVMANAKAGPPQTFGLTAGVVLGSPEFQRR